MVSLFTSQSGNGVCLLYMDAVIDWVGFVSHFFVLLIDLIGYVFGIYVLGYNVLEFIEYVLESTVPAMYVWWIAHA